MENLRIHIANILVCALPKAFTAKTHWLGLLLLSERRFRFPYYRNQNKLKERIPFRGVPHVAIKYLETLQKVYPNELNQQFENVVDLLRTFQQDDNSTNCKEKSFELSKLHEGNLKSDTSSSKVI